MGRIIDGNPPQWCPVEENQGREKKEAEILATSEENKAKAAGDMVTSMTLKTGGVAVPAFLKLQDDNNSTVSVSDILYYGIDPWDSRCMRMKWRNDNRDTAVNFRYYNGKVADDIDILNKLLVRND